MAITDVEKDLAPGYCSYRNRRVAIRKSHMVASSEIDTMILQGLFLMRGVGGLGYGGGYYDRFHG